ncbi:MAG: hypothetical protein M3294_00545 [Pseudomonadota bacterium]|jgi:hypothetical protein|nr:hypothetical protein [Pseudomonadota bacterium]
MKYHIMEPHFDNPFSAMPNLRLTEAQVEAITRYLMGGQGKGFIGELKDKLLRNEQRRLIVAFGIRVLGGLLIWFVSSGLTRVEHRHA